MVGGCSQSPDETLIYRFNMAGNDGRVRRRHIALDRL